MEDYRVLMGQKIVLLLNITFSIVNVCNFLYLGKIL